MGDSVTEDRSDRGNFTDSRTMPTPGVWVNVVVGSLDFGVRRSSGERNPGKNRLKDSGRDKIIGYGDTSPL